METQNPGDAEASAADQRNLDRLRMTRLHDYLKESLSASDSLQANIGAEKTDVMLLALRLKAVLESALNAGEDVYEDFQRIQPLLKYYLKLSQLSHQLAKLDRRLATAMTPITPGPPPEDGREQQGENRAV